MLARLFLVTLTGALFYFMISAHAATISLSSKVDNIRYELGGVELSLENIDSKMRISPTVEGKLLVEDVHARRLVVTMADDAPPGKPSTGLPEKISLPVAIRVKAARIDEIVIISGNEHQTLTDVAFNLEADDKILRLELVHATTPWGDINSTLALDNTKPYPLSGNLRIKQAKAAYPYEIDLKLGGNLEQLHFNMAGLIADQNRQTALLTADRELNHAVETGRTLGKLSITGQLGLDDGLPLNVKAQLTEFSPNISADSQTGILNLDLLLHGTLGPAADLQVEIQAIDSTWNNAPLQLKGSGKLLGKTMQAIELDATLKTNRLTAKGAIGDAALPFSWQAGFADISAFDQTLSGSINAKGTIEGALDNLTLAADWLAEQLRLSDSIQIKQLGGQARLNSHADGQLSADIHAEAMQLSERAPFNADLELRGTRQDHQLEIKATADENSFHSLINARFSDTGQWLAQLEKFALQGQKPVAMERSATLQYDSTSGFSLSNLALRFSGGRLYLDHLQSGAGQVSTHGRMVSLGLQDIPDLLLSLPENITGNPIFSGSWNIEADNNISGNEINGFAKLALESGDISIASHDDAVQALGLQAMVAELQFQQNQVIFHTHGNGSALGTFELDLTSRLSQTASGLALASSAPLQIKADASLQTLRWLPLPESMAGALMDGQVSIALLGDGTVGQPMLNGELQGQNLTFILPGEGVNLTNGVLDADFSNDQLLIKHARFQGGEGFLTANGALSLDQGKPDLTLDWRAENFTAASRTDRVIVIEGSIHTALRHDQLEASGQMEIIRGLVELPREDAPTLSDDVVVIGRPAEQEKSPLLMKISALKIGVGNTDDSQFILRGRGLDATLVGTLTLNGAPNQALHADGSIQASGTYMAYGQVLNIERGQLNFSGPVENPGLDILALRQNLAVRAGVEIKGSVLMPVVKLVSIPEVSDSDKLSWLVLGHGIDEAGQDQFAMLSLAAGALLSQGQSVPMQTRFARAAGLDSFNIGGGDVESASVSLGKRLASNLYLSYEKEVTGLLNVARLTYDITNRWSIRTQAGSESAVDVLYTFSFK